MNPCQKEECNICSMPARASGVYKNSWERRDAKVRWGIQSHSSRSFVFLYIPVIGGSYSIYKLYKKGEITFSGINPSFILSFKSMSLFFSQLSR